MDSFFQIVFCALTYSPPVTCNFSRRGANKAPSFLRGKLTIKVLMCQELPRFYDAKFCTGQPDVHETCYRNVADRSTELAGGTNTSRFQVEVQDLLACSHLIKPHFGPRESGNANLGFAQLACWSCSLRNRDLFTCRIVIFSVYLSTPGPFFPPSGVLLVVRANFRDKAPLDVHSYPYRFTMLIHPVRSLASASGAIRRRFCTREMCNTPLSRLL